jgi:hypothetical protein
MRRDRVFCTIGSSRPSSTLISSLCISRVCSGSSTPGGSSALMIYLRFILYSRLPDSTM